LLAEQAWLFVDQQYFRNQWKQFVCEMLENPETDNDLHHRGRNKVINLELI
jgi:hypothetical protein